MKWVHTLGLIFAILGLWIFNWKLFQHSKFSAETYEGRELYNERNIRKISIKFKRETIVIEKRPHHIWQLTQPFNWPVNPFALEKFFKTLAFEKEIPSKAKIELEKSDGTVVTLKANEKESNFFQGEVLSKILEQGVAFWYEQRLYLQKPSEIGQIDFIFHRTQQKFSLVKKKNRWEFLSPIAIEADAGEVQNFLEHIITWEVSPFKDKSLQKDRNGRANSESTVSTLKNFEITMTLCDIRQRRLSIHLKKKVFDTISQKDVYLACLDGGEAYFFVPLNEVFEHPLQSLCHQSLFPEIHSVALSYRGKKLFLSCNEAGKWSTFKLLEKETALQLLENFDEKIVLLCLSLIRPLNVLEKSTLNEAKDGEKLILEINETLKFELRIVKNEVYLVPSGKNYAIKIENNSMPKLIEILEKE
ncbi:MAG: DUF4340 domain-containing protein [Puniceicoccales bacterium]|jgi:hypothetical protein|nr:DUF4340 domain-containing protein [Puniceicoccales bacterium]